MTRYFTFGQDHVHVVNGITWDKDCLCKITADDPREVMLDTFGTKWSMEYQEPPNLNHYSRGIIKLDHDYYAY